jgi:hypothetical protein
LKDLFAAIARQTLDAVARPYPHHLVHLLNGDADARTARELHPAFCGSFDWHSSVHGHWCLARLARLYPEAEFAPAARAWLGRSLTPANLYAELSYLRAPGREGFERPYGLAWILMLAWEVGEVMAPLEALAAERLLQGWEKLTVPVRSGEHSQTAFAMGFAWDWAERRGNRTYVERLATLARRFYGDDRDAPIAYDLSAADFLSPILAEADVMRRVLEPQEFDRWLAAFLPELDRTWLTPVRAVDRADGKLSHWDGLNLSRAWMLEAVAEALPPGARRATLEEAARRHREAGLAACLSEHFAGAHWLGSFAVHLLSRREAS